ncbi:MAG: WYL domain-containing protein [Actinomycetota bacterium]
MSVNKLERLLNLTAVLLDTPRPLTADELRQKVDGYPPPGAAFHRTFERDKDDLRVLGIPIRVERVPATDPPIDGYRIAAEDYYLPDPGLDPDELAALHLASLTVRLEGLADQEALWKLGGVVADPEAGAPSADPGVVGDPVASIPADPNLVPLFQAISERRVVRFPYRGEDRLVEPWRLDFHRGRWYLTGWDRLREGQRNFRLDRIDGPAAATGEEATAPVPRDAPEGPRPAWELGGDEPVTARLLVDEARVESARRQLSGTDGPPVRSEERSDGSVVFEVPVVNHDAFRAFVLGFLDHAELLEPAAWRDDLVSWLEAIESGSHQVPTASAPGRTDGAADR